jgi:hypothetical protein
MGNLVATTFNRTGFGKKGVFGDLFSVSDPVAPPPVPRAIEPPKATTDTTQASEQARKKAPKGLIEQSTVAGELTPSESFLTGKKKKLGGK